MQSNEVNWFDKNFGELTRSLCILVQGCYKKLDEIQIPLNSVFRQRNYFEESVKRWLLDKNNIKMCNICYLCCADFVPIQLLKGCNLELALIYKKKHDDEKNFEVEHVKFNKKISDGINWITIKINYIIQRYNYIVDLVSKKSVEYDDSSCDSDYVILLLQDDGGHNSCHEMNCIKCDEIKALLLNDETSAHISRLSNILFKECQSYTRGKLRDLSEEEKEIRIKESLNEHKKIIKVDIDSTDGIENIRWYYKCDEGGIGYNFEQTLRELDIMTCLDRSLID